MRPTGPYTLLLSDTEGEVLEIGSVQSEVTMEIPFKMTRKEIDEVMRAGSEERNVTRCNMLLVVEVLKIGQAEYKYPQMTLIGIAVSSC